MSKKPTPLSTSSPKVQALVQAANEAYARVREAETRIDSLQSKVKTTKQTALESARTCGKALNEARWLVQKWPNKKWMPWLAENFRGSYETAKVYIRISKTWDRPDIVKARQDGTINSIRSYMDFLRRKPPSSDPAADRSAGWSESKKKADMIREELRRQFAQAIREGLDQVDLPRVQDLPKKSRNDPATRASLEKAKAEKPCPGLELEELETFVEQFNDLWMRWRLEIYEATCGSLRRELDEYIAEREREGPRRPPSNIAELNQQAKAEVRQQVQKAHRRKIDEEKAKRLRRKIHEEKAKRLRRARHDARSKMSANASDRGG